jgi:hypothetical protein
MARFALGSFDTDTNQLRASLGFRLLKRCKAKGIGRHTEFSQGRYRVVMLMLMLMLPQQQLTELLGLTPSLRRASNEATESTRGENGN